MKYPIIKKALAGLCFVLFASSVFSQSTDFSYKEKGRSQYGATIYFSDNGASEQVAPEDFSSYEDVFFTVKTSSLSEKDYFKESDIEEWFSKINVSQSGKMISMSNPPKGINNADEKIDRILLSFAKDDVKLFKPFVFINSIDTSAAINLSDTYFSLYNEYLPIYQQSMELSDKLKYIDTYNKVKKIVVDAKTTEEIKYFSFYSHASNALITNAILQKADTLSKLMLKESEAFKSKVSLSGLNTIDSIYTQMEESRTVFSPYFEMGETKSDMCFETYAQMLEAGAETQLACHELYQAKVLEYLETGSYSEYKFGLYLDLLVRMVTRLDTLRVLGDLQQLDISIIDAMPGVKDELKLTNWYVDFKTIVEVLNMGIEKNGKVFNDKIIENLQVLKPTEHEPYLQIFLAFNELSENKSLFANYLKNALNFCTDEELIVNIEMWILSFNLSAANVSEFTVHQINQGILMVNNQNWTGAKKTFSTITKQANNIAPPWFFLGKIQFRTDEIYTAEAKFNRALDIYPQYIAPRLFNVKMLYDQGRYEELLGDVEAAIEISDIWLYHFWKAKALYGLEKYNLAITEINDQCVRLNPFNLEEFFLLGDIYLKIEDFDQAREAYGKTQEIDIYKSEELFNEKMRALQELKN